MNDSLILLFNKRRIIVTFLLEQHIIIILDYDALGSQPDNSFGSEFHRVSQEINHDLLESLAISDEIRE